MFLQHTCAIVGLFRLSPLYLILFVATPAFSADSVEVPAVKVYGTRTAAGVTENSGSYTTTTMTSATGMRLSEKDTPQATQVITRQRMDDQKLTLLRDVMEQTTGVTAQAFDRGRTSYYARGFQVDKYQIDGLNVNYNNQWINGENTNNMVLYDHVEVVRGADGLTSGAGNPGVVVNLVRKHSDAGKRKTSLEAGIGSHSAYEATFDHNQPIADNGDYKVSTRVIGSRQAGKSGTDMEKQSQNILYGVVDAQIGNAELSAGASVRSNHQKSYMWGGLPAVFSDGTVADWPRSKTTSTDWSVWNSRNNDFFVNGKYKFNNNWNIELLTGHSHNRGESRLMYISGNVDKSTGLGYSVYPARFATWRKQSNAQLTVNGKYPLLGATHDLVFGGQYSRIRQHYDTYETGNRTPDATPDFYTWDGRYTEPNWSGRNNSVNLTDIEYGLFAANRFNIADRAGILLGSRLASWKRNGTSYNNTANMHSGNIWLPYAGLTINFNDNHTFYASYTDTFKAQDRFDKDGKNLDPTRGKNYEIGLKSSYFNDNLSSQISLFRIKQDNVAQQDGDNTVAGSPQTQAYFNAKGVRTHGYEIELNGRVTPQWNITAGFAWARGKDAEGRRINTDVPERSIKLFTAYDFTGRLQGLTVGGGLNWQSGRYVETESPAPQGGTVKIEQESILLANLMARYKIGKRFTVQVNADNLFDKKYYDQLNEVGQYNYGEGRNIRASVKYEF